MLDRFLDDFQTALAAGFGNVWRWLDRNVSIEQTELLHLLAECPESGANLEKRAAGNAVTGADLCKSLRAGTKQFLAPR